MLIFYKSRPFLRNVSLTFKCSRYHVGTLSPDQYGDYNRLGQRRHKTIFRFSDQTFFVSTVPGLEPILEQELQCLGVKTLDYANKARGGLHVQLKSLEQLYNCHLHLGSCSHIFLRAGNEFIARGMDELVRKVSKLPIWTQLIPVYDTPPKFKIKVSTKESKLFHTIGVAERVRKGIHMAFGQESLDYKQSVKSDDASAIPIMVRIRKDKVQISVDSSTTPIHKRGYRLESSKAPLREDLAYAALYSMGWKDKNLNTEGVMIIDPMCGSGTILIEAASMLFKLPPGRYRDPPMKNTILSDPDLWKQMVELSVNCGEKMISDYIDNHESIPLVVGSDRDQGAVNAAIGNILRAGLSKVISIEHCAISSNPWLNSTSQSLRCNSIFLVTNPPYGIRVSTSKVQQKVHALLPLYQTIGNIVNSNDSVRLGLIVHDISLARKTGVKDLKTMFTTQHGGLTVSLIASHD